MAETRYDAIRPFRQTDLRTGADTNYEINDPYTGPLDLPYLLDPAGPDGKGPLIAKKTIPTPAPAASASTSSKKEQ